MPDLCYLTAAELIAGYRRRRLSPIEITDAVIDRAIALNPHINAFITINADDARRQARELAREVQEGRLRGPLHGVPVSIKDIIDQQGVATTAASRARRDHIASADATVVARLKRAGAILIGKCNLHEFAAGITSAVSAAGPVHNPWDLTRSAGGSSGGSAAAVAAGIGVASIGTDTGGSIRIPAGACGVVGLKATFGRVSRAGVVPLSWSFDHVGPLTRTVQDAATVCGVIAGADGADPSTRARAVPPLDHLSAARVRGLRVGVLRGMFFEGADADVSSRVEDALRALGRGGAILTDVSIPHASDVGPVYTLVSRPERTAYHEREVERQPEGYDRSIRTGIEVGRYVSAVDYVQAQRMRSILLAETRAALQSVDVIVLPNGLTSPPLLPGTMPVAAGDTARPPTSISDGLTRNLWLFNLTGHPVLALPCGFTDAGLPVGMQIVARHWAESALLSVGMACERLLDLGDRRPPVRNVAA
jgi:aspartyl-tRNA(Asn)/glutamyl-tRNA(Gln) amidotransferase subunit A